MSKRLPPVAKAPKDAAIYTAIATGTETHEQIAARLGCTRQHVSRVAKQHRARIEAAAEETIQAAVDGPREAIEKARNAAPEALDTMIEIMRGVDSDGRPIDLEAAPVRLAAAKSVADRAGVAPKVDVGVSGSVSIVDLIADKARRAT